MLAILSNPRFMHKTLSLLQLLSTLSSDQITLTLVLQIHRHHLSLKWPVGDTFLNTRPVVVHVDEMPDPDASEKDLFKLFSRINGKLFSCIRDIQFEPWSHKKKLPNIPAKSGFNQSEESLPTIPIDSLLIYALWYVRMLWLFYIWHFFFSFREWKF